MSSLLWVNLFEISLTAQMKKLMAKLGPYPPPPSHCFLWSLGLGAELPSL